MIPDVCVGRLFQLDVVANNNVDDRRSAILKNLRHMGIRETKEEKGY